MADNGNTAPFKKPDIQPEITKPELKPEIKPEVEIPEIKATLFSIRQIHAIREQDRLKQDAIEKEKREKQEAEEAKVNAEKTEKERAIKFKKMRLYAASIIAEREGVLQVSSFTVSFFSEKSSHFFSER